MAQDELNPDSLPKGLQRDMALLQVGGAVGPDRVPVRGWWSNSCSPGLQQDVALLQVRSKSEFW
jgi:hypothetical protein